MSGNILDVWDYIFSLAMNKRTTASMEEAVEKTNGEFNVTYSVTGDLFLRANEIVRHLEAWKAAKTNGARLAKRREIRKLIPKLYADVCLECQKSVLHRAVKHACDLRDKASWSNKMACFYEAAQKWLIKTGCTVCPLQEKLDSHRF